jgi:hypothetical protein
MLLNRCILTDDNLFVISTVYVTVTYLVQLLEESVLTSCHHAHSRKPTLMGASTKGALHQRGSIISESKQKISIQFFPVGSSSG